MGWTDRFRRKPAMESRAEWGSSAIPLPNEGNANTYANVDLRRADTAMQKVAVWAAVMLLSRLVGSLPLDTYRRRGNGPPVNIGNSRFIEDPAGDDHGLPDWLAQYMTSKLLRGNVYGKQILGPDAYPTQIVLYHPDTVDGWRDLYTGQVHWYVEGRDVGPNGVWHRRSYPMPGNLLGMSPIGLHMTTIGQGMAAARFGYQFFADGAMPTGMLRNTEVAIDPKVAAVAKARWMAAMHGSREPAVMGKGWEYNAIQIAPEESQFLETQKYTAAECARIYGPGVPEILGYETGGSMTYANVDQRSLHLLIYSLDPWLTGLERMFTRMLPQPQFVKFNRSALLRMTTDQRYAAYQIASLIGLQTPNEQRAMEDWAPVAWGDKPWVAAQQAPPPPPAEQAGARDRLEVRSASEDDGAWDEMSTALLVALEQLDYDMADPDWGQRAWNTSQAAKHVRIPAGQPGGGRFMSVVDQLKGAIEKHAKGGGGAHPFEGFNREQLRKVAKARGIELKRGEDRDSIAAKLLGHLGGGAHVSSSKAGKKPTSATAKLTDEQIENGLKMYGTDSVKGKQLLAEKARRAPTQKIEDHTSTNLTPEQEMERWRADAAKPGRVQLPGTGPTKRDMYLASWETNIARARKDIDDAKAAGEHSRLPNLQKTLDYYVTGRDNMRVNPDPDLDDPASGPTFERVQPVDPGRPLSVYGDMLHMEGSDDSWTHANMTALERVPADIHAVVAAHLAEKESGGIWISDTAVSDMNHSHDLAGEEPRGWGDGKTFDDVNGVYRTARRALLIGRTANSTYRGEKTATHEFGHGLDDALGTPSAKADWQAIHEKALQGKYLSPYYRQPGHAGREEFWAESFSAWSSPEETGIPLWRLQTQLQVSPELAREIDSYFNKLAGEIT